MSRVESTSALNLALRAKRARAEAGQALRADPIAVIGMGCRTPGGVHTPEALWALLIDGRSAIGPVPAERWASDAWFDVDPAAPGKSLTRRGGFLDRIDGFDAAYFGILPREAERMDPQQRLLLEVALEALDDAGLPDIRLRGSRAGVFIASYHNDYAQLQYADLDVVDARTLTGTLHSVLTNRLSYFLDLRGPSISIDTACSSSLVALHLACQSLRFGESDLAVAGGVSLMITPELMVSLSKVGFMAPDGECKTFDAAADGFGRGEGCGVVVLKRLADAVADGDRVLAVVRGSAVNSDGHSTLLAAPNGLAQQAMLREALANAQLDASRIGYVEAHGTGTALGDPIEVEALAATVGVPLEGAGPCYLGAAKANIGHLEASAGVIGLIKTVLALRHERVPPQPNFHKLSPHITLAGSRLVIADRAFPWPVGDLPRCAGVSSFGVGGTNAHVVIEEAPRLPSEDLPQRGVARLLTLSAKSREALRALAQAWVGWLPGTPASFADVCFTASERRSHHEHRLAIVDRDKAGAAARLTRFVAGEESAAVVSGRLPLAGRARVAFVFSGQGPQWHAMGRELLAQEPVFRSAIEAVDALLRPLSGWSLIAELAMDESASRLAETEIAQPALFALQVALAAWWKSVGVVPDAVVGHSVGEIAALHVAGVLTLADAVRVVWNRGHIMQQATGLGRMASVGLDETTASERVAAYRGLLSVGAINGPRSVVLSGDEAALRQALAELTARGISHRLLPVQYAFHSAQMAPFERRLTDALAGLRCAAPAIPVFSTVTGALLGPAPVGADHFGRNVRAPVRFSAAISAMMQAEFDAFVEIGPHPVLSGALAECMAGSDLHPAILASLRRGKPERESLLHACAGLHVAGAALAWALLNPVAGQVVDLPAYPWQRKRFWIRKRPVTPSAGSGAPTSDALLGRRLATAGTRIVIFEGDAGASRSWLAQHRIFGKWLLPAAAMLEMFAAAARHVLGVAAVELGDFTITRPLVIGEGDADTGWQLVATRSGQHAVDLELHGRAADGASWDLVAHADAREDNAAPGVAERPPTDASTATVPNLEAVYERFAALGADFGPAFRSLRDVRVGEGSAAGTLVSHDDFGAAGHALHPALLDGALQLCSLAAGQAQDGALPARLWLPLGAGRMHVWSGAAGPLQAHARVRQGSSSTLTADVAVCTPDGRLVVLLEGMAFAPGEADAVAASRAVDDLLYQVAWDRAPLPLAGVMPPTRGVWLVLSDRAGTGEALAQALNAGGASCIEVRLGTVTAQVAERIWTVDPSRPGAFDAVLAAAGPLVGVVHLWGLDLPRWSDDAASDFDTQDLCGIGSALPLVQALAAAPAPLWLATRGAATVTGAEPREALCTRAAGLAGLAGVVAVEHPELRVRHVDLDPGAPDASLDGLLEELRAEAMEARESAWRAGERWTPRLIRYPPAAPVAAQKKPGTVVTPIRWVVERAGTLDGMALRPVATPTAVKADEVRIRVLASGINFRDVLLALGMYDAPGVGLGAECAGEVIEAGSDVHLFGVGDIVFGFAPGSMAQMVDVPAAFLARVPEGLAVEAAAGLPVAFLTAWYGLHSLARLQAGERVLIHAGAGGVGMAAIQLARRRGAVIFATAGSEAKRSLLRDLGVRHVGDSRSLAFADEIRAATGGAGVDAVLNSLAGEFIDASLGVLAEGGRFLELGKRDILSADAVRRIRPDVHYAAFDLGSEALADRNLLRPMFDGLLAALADGSLEPLPVTVYPFAEAPEAFRHIARAQHVGKVVLRTGAPTRVRAKSTYLITGGLGGLGLATARWLVDAGATHLALTGRHAPGADACAALAGWNTDGVEVRVFEADAGDAQAMATVFAEIDRGLPPLRGVVHAAGSVEVALLARQTPGQVRGVLRGKAHGAWLLHSLTRHRPLDFFILYSAAGVLLGAAGQGAYAGANAELDALAHARQRWGLRALSVAWGAWADVGMAAKTAAAGGVDAWTARGLGKIAPAVGFAALDRLLQDGAAHAAVLPIDWSRFAATLPDGLAPGFYAAVTRSIAATTVNGREPAPRVSAGLTAPSAPSAALRAAPAGQRRRLLLDELTRRVLQVIGLELSQPIDPRRALKDAGLDSLMAVELRNVLARAFALPLPATLLFDYPTLDLLCTCLLRLLGLQADANPAAVTPAAPGASPSEAEVAGLSDAEAEAELMRELGFAVPETP